MSPITTHVLNTSIGKPGEGVRVRLEREEKGAYSLVGEGVTNKDGRITDLMEEGSLQTGEYRITFEIGDYFAALGQKSFYPRATVDFEVLSSSEHYHVPLLVNPFGYSTYRGS